jgi:hypothetical protein
MVKGASVAASASTSVSSFRILYFVPELMAAVAVVYLSFCSSHSVFHIMCR